MKRLMPSALIAFLQSVDGANCLKADLFIITLPTGAIAYVTEGQFDITVPSGTPGWSGATVTFKAMQYGRWTRGAITSEAAFDCKANTMALTCVPQPGTTYPGLAIGILSAALNSLFDAAKVLVMTAYMPTHGDVSKGLETKWTGTITKVNAIDRVHVEFECADPMYLLNMKVPTRLIQSTCPWGFADSNCGLNPANYTQAITAAAGSTQWLVACTPSEPTGYFDQGVIKCLTGLNAGLTLAVKRYVNGTGIVVMNPWLFPVSAGDTFTVIKGCDKSVAMCGTTKATNGTTTDNRINFGGAPFVPVPTTAI